jgi:hypothetical protein
VLISVQNPGKEDRFSINSPKFGLSIMKKYEPLFARWLMAANDSIFILKVSLMGKHIAINIPDISLYNM